MKPGDSMLLGYYAVLLGSLTLIFKGWNVQMSSWNSHCCAS